MSAEPNIEQREYDLMLNVFNISAAMVGVCLTAIGILRLITSQSRIETISDDLLAMDAVVFTACCFLSFWSFKTRKHNIRNRLRLIVDILFGLALLSMAIVCAVIVYAVT
jgi:hypothetical protein